MSLKHPKDESLMESLKDEIAYTKFKDTIGVGNNEKSKKY